MSDTDAISDVRERLAEFEDKLGRMREGKKPAPSFDLLAWTAGTLSVAPEGKSTGTSARFIDTVRQTPREDWHGLHEAVAAWAARIDERFPQ